MKKFLFPVLILAALISCDKKPGSLKFSEAIAGGCSTGKGMSVQSFLDSEIDRVTYSFVNGNLDLFVGFNATCCGQYSTSYEIAGDTILIDILTVQAGQCNCICFYSYDFKFTGDGNNYNYRVKIDNKVTFSGEITL